jgi:ribonuclease E
MAQRMLIDARHPEETRVAVVNGNRIEEFDFEAADKKQLKGNIYLAKVTRVEPSLQAAFVEYGGNRHGFLAFAEIHPDYYQIPREDREALLREEAALAEDEAHEPVEGEDGEEVAEVGGGDGDTDVMRRQRQALRRRYKIQEVIRRRQVLLIQVVKEERGNKGAALTTYLSLAGRYCVLMPNTAHGGGISRKISNLTDRKRLKRIMADLHLPAGMGAIVRTAGLKRTSAEIKRDFDYLTRLWDEIRETTLASEAPCLVHQDSDLIKRAIRDIYTRDIEQVLVEGETGYTAARTFMQMLMPAHAKKVVQYTDPVPLFQRFGVEGQLEAMYSPVVQLRSGGYIVINPTEALVSIDINSGRSTREHGIEDTAFKTNMEAAEEIGRQLRLRDMAGLVVIDFIDMEVGGNNRRVERAMKDALKHDRARIQIGRISSFGLMEMSRQRLRTGVLEASTHICPMCDGSGTVRSVSSAALAALRGLEAEAVKGRCSEFTLNAGREVAVYILNRKRAELNELEDRYGIQIATIPSDELLGPNFTIEAGGPPPSKPVTMSALPPPVVIEEDDEIEDAEVDLDDEDDDADAAPARRGRRDEVGDADAGDDAETGDGEPGESTREGGRDDARDDSRNERGGRGRRRRRSGGRTDRRGEPRREGEAEPLAAEGGTADAVRDASDEGVVRDGVAIEPGVGAEQAGTGRSENTTASQAQREPVGDTAEDGERKRRRRGRRGGRRREGDGAVAEGSDASASDPGSDDDMVAATAAGAIEPATGDQSATMAVGSDTTAVAAPKTPGRDAQQAVGEGVVDAAPAEAEAPARKPRRPRSRKSATAPELEVPAAEPAAAAEAELALPTEAEPAKPARRRAAPRKAKTTAIANDAVETTPVVEAREPVARPAQVVPDAVAPDNQSAAVPANDANGDAIANGDTSANPRKGWWQRTFGA